MLKSLYLTARFFWILGGIILLILVSFFLPQLEVVALLLPWVLLGVLVIDIVLLYRTRKGISASRQVGDRLSNGDQNPVRVFCASHFPLPVSVKVVDEIPHQFQRRDFEYDLALKPGQEQVLSYELRPVTRGVYSFGRINAFARTQFGLAERRFHFEAEKEVAVYPSFLQMRRYQFLAFSRHARDAGIRNLRRVGQSMEFEKIREYVPGDDYRTLNWKATARRAELMVNQMQEERAQHIYSVIDKGRVMKMPFEGMTLLDYAINASLAFSSIALLKHDQAGLITFQKEVEAMLPAQRQQVQLQRILEVLYNQQTAWQESNLEVVLQVAMKRLTQYSLLMLYTNFESVESLQRQLPYLRALARKHLLVVVFFENTELEKVTKTEATDVEEVYRKVVAEQFQQEKQQITLELQRHGIHSILTRPEQLTIHVINKYLELKARALI